MAPGDTARLYHRLTSYTPEREWTTPVDDPRVLQGFKQIDIPTFPAACKLYPPGLPAVALPREWPAPTAGALDLAALARVLHLSAGVARGSPRPGRRPHLFPAAGAARGGLPPPGGRAAP